jgi:hypothetical protein
LATDAWNHGMPHFADPKDLMTTQLANKEILLLQR